MASDKSYDTKARFDAFMTQAGPVATITGIANVTTTGIKTLAQLLVPANTITGIEKYVLEAQGGFTTNIPAPTSVDFYVYWGSTGSGVQLVDLSVPSAGLITGVTNAGWGLRAVIYFQSTTALSVKLSLEWHTATGASGSAQWFIVKQVTGLDTTADKNITLATSFTGSGYTLMTDGAHIGREA